MKPSRPVLLGLMMIVFAVLAPLFDLVGMLSYLLVLLGIASGSVVAVVLGVRQVLRRRVAVAPLLYPGTAIVVGAVGLFAGYLSGPAPVLPESESAGKQLAYMRRTDRGDRMTLRFLRTNRDDLRLVRTRRLLEAGLVKSPEDLLNAAMVLQHGRETSDYAAAYALASMACSRGVDTDVWPERLADWVRRSAYDRWMLSTGRKQRRKPQGLANRLADLLEAGTAVTPETGTLSGTVVDDSTGEELAGASIALCLQGISTGYGTQADLEGRYEVTNVPTGRYDVECSYMGYNTGMATGVLVTQDQTEVLDFRLGSTAPPPVEIQVRITTFP